MNLRSKRRRGGHIQIVGKGQEFLTVTVAQTRISFPGSITSCPCSE